MKRTLPMIAILALATMPARAETWPTNCFPGWMHWREQVIMNRTINSALVERVTAVTNALMIPYLDPVPSPVWYRSNRGDLINYKNAVKAMLGYYARTNSQAGYLAYFNEQNEYSELPFPSYGAGDVNLVLAEAKLPTNYLDNTPWRCLDGLGPYTNDTTVGHGHGWTAAYTATNKAGNNFPASRTNWYTTDYGWDGMTSILSRLIWVAVSPPTPGSTTAAYWGENNVSRADWATATNSAETNWSLTVASYAYQVSKGIGLAGAVYAALGSASNRVVGNCTATLQPQAGELYFWSKYPLYYDDRASDDIVYDPLDTPYNNKALWTTNDYLDPYITDPYGMQVAAALGVSASNCWVSWGATNQAPWGESSETASNNISAVGWDTHSLKAVLYKYDWTNGFRWR